MLRGSSWNGRSRPVNCYGYSSQYRLSVIWCKGDICYISPIRQVRLSTNDSNRLYRVSLTQCSFSLFCSTKATFSSLQMSLMWRAHKVSVHCVQTTGYGDVHARTRIYIYTSPNIWSHPHEYYRQQEWHHRIFRVLLRVASREEISSFVTWPLQMR